MVCRSSIVEELISEPKDSEDVDVKIVVGICVVDVTVTSSLVASVDSTDDGKFIDEDLSVATLFAAVLLALEVEVVETPDMVVEGVLDADDTTGLAIVVVTLDDIIAVEVKSAVDGKVE